MAEQGLEILENFSNSLGGVTGKFGLGIGNEAGQSLIEFCQENVEGHHPGACERAGEQSPYGEEAELGNVHTTSINHGWQSTNIMSSRGNASCGFYL